MDHSDIDHDNFKSAYLKVLGINNDQEESIDEARLITKDGKFIVMTDNDTEAATFEDRESALEYIKNNKEKLSVRDEKTKVTTDKVEAKEGKEVFIVPEEIVDTKERNAFMGAAAAAHKAGKSHFNFAGKKHKVTMSKDTAKAINNSVKEDARDHCHSKDHDCATIVHHPKWGIGKPIYESHAIPTDDGYAFMGAAAAAHKAGKSHFNFAGKKHKVTMSKDTAKAINNSVKEDARDHCHSKDHDCATIVHHPKWGIGKPIYESHAIPTDDGYVAWYDVEFDHGIEREVPTEDMTVYTTEKHKMNAAKKVKEADVKYPHPMYDPKTGEKVMAKTPADHNKYDKMGYTHEKPNIDENNPAHFAAIAKNNAKRDKEMGRSPTPNMYDPKFKMTKRDGTKDRMNPTGAMTGYRSKIEAANPMSKLTPTQRQALSRMKVKKKSDVTLPGMDLMKKDEKPKMKPGRQSQIVKYEGYEADVSKFMNKHGIDHHWSGGKLHVDKKDHACR